MDCKRIWYSMEIIHKVHMLLTLLHIIIIIFLIRFLLHIIRRLIAQRNQSIYGLDIKQIKWSNENIRISLLSFRNS